MRFAFISTMFGPQWGGSEELWSQSAMRLKRAGHEVQASVVNRPRRPAKVNLLTQHGIEIDEYFWRHRTGRTRRIWNKFSLKMTRSYARLKHFNPDLVIISQGHNSGGFEWAKFCRDEAIPYVLIVQCNGDHWWFGEQIDEAIESYSSARRIFCVSRANRDLLSLQLGEPLLNSEVVRNPFNVSTDRLPSWPDEDVKWRIACVARLEVAAKGQELLLQTLALPEWRNLPIELNFYGEGPDKLALRRIAKMFQLKNVHFHGHVADIEAIWRENHLLALPSRYEGLPLALIEAMWCGRPAVVTDVGGNADFCLDGQTGFVASSATLTSVSDALMRAWERRSDWKSLGQVARNFVETEIPKDPVATSVADC